MFNTFRTKFLEKRGFRLKWIFIIYVSVILGFAKLYDASYDCDHASFVFAGDIYQSQVRNQNIEVEAKKKLLKRDSQYLDSLKFLIQKNCKPPDSSFEVMNTMTYRYKFKNVFIDFDIDELGAARPDLYTGMHDVIVFDTAKASNDFSMPTYFKLKLNGYPYDKLSVILKLIDKKNEETLSKLKDKQDTEAKWAYLDFVYFSTITQATVGYGDMLPNSRLIRLLVVAQILIGVIITVFFIAYEATAFQSGIKKFDNVQ